MNNVLAILQARTSSSRLPAKVLLPVGGIPLAVLAAKRAANTGLEVLVATSDDASDDLLASILGDHGIRCVRGPLENTLERFIIASEDRRADDIVVRLTGDNVFPDGRFIEGLVSEFIRGNFEYLASDSETSGLPFGMRGEVFRVASLREAAKSAIDVYDCEHVTPWIIRRAGRQQYKQYSHLGLGQQRATIDQLDDYLRISTLFSTIDDPIHFDAIELSRRLATISDSPRISEPISDLVVGTAQLGTPYGVNNSTGKPTDEVATRIVRTAIMHGVQGFDTARAYGESELTLGKALSGGWASRASVITKVDPMDEIADCVEPRISELLTELSVAESSRNLNTKKLDTVLLHRISQLDNFNGSVWSTLVRLSRKGRIAKLGVSIQDPSELIRAISEPEIAHIQLPFNILDGRWTGTIDGLSNAKSIRPISVHIRSALLQGVLASNSESLWASVGIPESTQILSWLRGLVTSLNRIDVKDLAISFARSQPWCDGVVIGMETEEQLRSNFHYFQQPKLEPDELHYIEATRPTIPVKALNPALWKLNT